MNVTDERALWLGRQILPHEPALRAWLCARRLNGLEIDDIIQETYTRLLTVESVEHVLNEKAYMFQTANSVVLSHFRRMKVLCISSVADIEQLNVLSPEPSPERQVIDRDELSRLAGAIARLPLKVRQVFQLRRVHGFSQREVSQKLKISESTVEKHMSRAYLLLLNEFFDGGKGSLDTSNNKIQSRFNVYNAKKNGPGN